MVLLHSNINTADKEAVELVLAQLDKLENVQRAMPLVLSVRGCVPGVPLPRSFNELLYNLAVLF